MNRYYLITFLGCGKSEANEVSKADFQTAIAEINQSSPYICVSHFPDEFCDGTIYESFVEHYIDEFEEWEKEIGFVVGDDEDDDVFKDCVDLGTALSHMFGD